MAFKGNNNNAVQNRTNFLKLYKDNEDQNEYLLQSNQIYSENN